MEHLYFHIYKDKEKVMNRVVTYLRRKAVKKLLEVLKSQITNTKSRLDGKKLKTQ